MLVWYRENNPKEAPTKVSELINQGEWNRDEMVRWFLNVEIEAITSIPLPRSRCKDTWAWKFTKHGEYVVRSGYYVELQFMKEKAASTSTSRPKDVWSRLWKANVPNKIKNFGWRALQGGLSVRKNLCLRGVMEDSICPMCGEEREDIIHALLLCREVKIAWQLSPLRIELKDPYAASLMEWVSMMEKRIKERDWWDLFWSSLWDVWLRRNAWVFEKRRITVEDMARKAVSFITEYKDSMENDPDSVQEGIRRRNVWMRPAVGMYKLNTDAAIFPDSKVGFGGIMRDEDGDIMMATSALQEGCFEVDETEAMVAPPCIDYCSGSWSAAY